MSDPLNPSEDTTVILATPDAGAAHPEGNGSSHHPQPESAEAQPHSEAAAIYPPEPVAADPNAATVEFDRSSVDRAMNLAGDLRPSDRIKIGSSNEGPAPVAMPVSADPAAPRPVAVTHTPPGKYPPPNIRGQLSEDLQAEFDAVVGGQAVDSLLESASSREAVRELAPETRVQGVVARIHNENIFLDLGGAKQGMLPLRQFEETPPPEVGATLEVLVVRLNPEEGLYELSLPTAAVEVGNWDEVKEGQVVEVAITGVNKGGLECQVSGIRGFMPMGQISIYRVENPEEYVGQRLSVVITEAKRSRRNLVVSHRALMERERAESKDKLLAELAPGQVREGVVRSLRDFGAFVDLGGVDGMIHVSKLSWERINHPRDVLTEGQKIKVKVEKVDRETGKIALSYRESAANPWDTAEAKYAVGSKVKGAVSKVMEFGAFVRLEPGVEGLIHISELDHGRVFRTGDVVSEGQEVETKVLSVDRDKQRIALSLRALKPRPEREPAKQEAPPIEFEQTPGRQRADRTKLKGGMSHKSGGEQFGLRW